MHGLCRRIKNSIARVGNMERTELRASVASDSVSEFLGDIDV